MTFCMRCGDENFLRLLNSETEVEIPLDFCLTCLDNFSDSAKRKFITRVRLEMDKLNEEYLKNERD